MKAGELGLGFLFLLGTLKCKVPGPLPVCFTLGGLDDPQVPSNPHRSVISKLSLLFLQPLRKGSKLPKRGRIRLMHKPKQLILTVNLILTLFWHLIGVLQAHGRRREGT